MSLPIRYLLATDQVECVTFTLAYALSESGAQVDLFLMPGASDSAVSKWYVKERLLCLPRVRVVDRPQGQYDRLVYETGAKRPEAKAWDAVLATFASSGKTVVIPGFEGGLLKRWKMSLGFLWRHRELLAHRWRWVWMALFPRGLDATTLLGPRAFLGVDVHANFLTDASLHQAIFEEPWSVADARPWPMNYVGSEKPEARQQALQAVATELQKVGLACDRGPQWTAGRVPWMVLGDVAPARYCDILNGSDFTLCPVGYVAWTHRVVEALCRGSIPILPAETVNLYGMPLVHGVNAWLVYGDDWAAAVRGALATSQAHRADMRRRIREMYADYLSPAACAAHMRQRLGVVG